MFDSDVYNIILSFLSGIELIKLSQLNNTLNEEVKNYDKLFFFHFEQLITAISDIDNLFSSLNTQSLQNWNHLYQKTAQFFLKTDECIHRVHNTTVRFIRDDSYLLRLYRARYKLWNGRLVNFEMFRRISQKGKPASKMIVFKKFVSRIYRQQRRWWNSERRECFHNDRVPMSRRQKKEETSAMCGWSRT